MAETQRELSESELSALTYRTRVEEALKRHELRVSDLEVATEAVKAAKCAIKQTAQYRELERAGERLARARAEVAEALEAWRDASRGQGQLFEGQP